MTYSDYSKCIQACLDCATHCDHCASSCLKEDDIKMMTICIQLDMECAVACYAAARLMGLGSDRAAAFCRLCAEICSECAEECGKHRHEHCRKCAEACRACAQECMQMAQPG